MRVDPLESPQLHSLLIKHRMPRIVLHVSLAECDPCLLILEQTLLPLVWHERMLLDVLPQRMVICLDRFASIPDMLVSDKLSPEVLSRLFSCRST